jgi:hypothetical protein
MSFLSEAQILEKMASIYYVNSRQYSLLALILSLNKCDTYK